MCQGREMRLGLLDAVMLQELPIQLTDKRATGISAVQMLKMGIPNALAWTGTDHMPHVEKVGANPRCTAFRWSGSEWQI